MDSFELIDRKTMSRVIADASARAAAGVPHALFVLHVERLGEVIEHCGEEGEAALLAIVGRRLGDQLGPGVPAARLCADRFAVVKDRCLPRDALTIARRIRNVLEGGVFRWRDLSFRVGVCVGVVEVVPGSSAGSMLERAANACSEARSVGGDGVLFIDDSPEARITVEREHAWRDHVREVIV